MITFFDYVSLAVCMSLIHAKNYDTDFSVSLFIGILAGIIIAPKNSYAIPAALVVILFYELVIKKNRAINILFNAVDTVEKLLFLMNIISFLLSIVFFANYKSYPILMDIAMVIVAVIYYKFANQTTIKKMSRPILIWNIVFKILSIILFVFCIPYLYSQFKNMVVFKSISFIYIFVSSGFYYFSNHIIQLLLEKERIDVTLQNHNLMKNLYEEIIVFKHLFKDLTRIKLTNDTDILSAFNSIKNEFENKVVSLSFLEDSKKINNEEMESLLTVFHLRSRAEEIEFYLFVHDEMKKISIDTVDLTKLMVTYLGNAINAAKESETRIVIVDIKKEKNCYHILIRNSVCHNNINKKSVGSKICDEIISNNRNIEKLQYLEAGFYTVELIIKHERKGERV